MSRHQYVRNLDYQEVVDEFEGYSEEEDELSPEDRAQMTQGTADVQAALGVEASKVTVTQIEEALWHYYYDIDKSVAYLISKFVNPRPKPTKPAAQPPNANGRFFSCAVDTPAAPFSFELHKHVGWARSGEDWTTGAMPTPPRFSHTASTLFTPGSRQSLSHFFHDMPWGRIPKHRETTFIPPPTVRGGLLGGAGEPPKLSKLQALAAARKKKAEEKKPTVDKVERAQADLKDLSINDTPGGKENLPAAAPSSKRLKTSGQGGQLNVVALFAPAPSEPLSAAGEGQCVEPPRQGETLGNRPQVAMAEPSAFARLLCGLDKKPKSKAPENPFPFSGGTARPLTAEQVEFGPAFEINKRKRDDSDTWEERVVLYPNLPQFVKDNFAQPSPDDVVLAAQAKAKGSLLNKSKR
jgi:elongation factor 1 alpha-like protein